MRGQLLHRNVKRFREGHVFQAYRLLYHSTLGSRVMKQKKKDTHHPRITQGSLNSRLKSYEEEQGHTPLTSSAELSLFRPLLSGKICLERHQLFQRRLATDCEGEYTHHSISGESSKNGSRCSLFAHERTSRRRQQNHRCSAALWCPTTPRATPTPACAQGYFTYKKTHPPRTLP